METEKEKRGFRPCPKCGGGVLAIKPRGDGLLTVRCERCGRTIAREDFHELTDAWNDENAEAVVERWFE